MNLVIRLCGRELLSVSAWVDEPEPEPVVHSFGFVGGELAEER